ncbi:MAG: 4Fe-4S binding protein [Nitrospirae bacterium]|nr:4Fe-4S binding protein [Nitrospirota bacterium]
MENIHNLADASLWLPVWQQKALHIAAFSVFLLFIILLMLFMNRLTGRRRLFNALRYITLCISFVYVGLVLKAQPTTTNIVILLNALRDIEFPLSTLYILEPYIFLSFIFILFTLIVWGRGVFCGWLCPYGAMLELLNKVYQKFSRFRIALPEKVHWKMVYLKYAIFLVIAGVSFYNFMLSEYLTEVEPFRTFVLKLRREWYFVLYFAVITAASVIIYRAFCRYLCPLGAALALPSLLKRMNITRVKFHDLCGTCKICGRDCSAQAIGKEGYIDSSECFYCMQCQLNFWDEDRCPVLIKQKAKGARAKTETL